MLYIILKKILELKASKILRTFKKYDTNFI